MMCGPVDPNLVSILWILLITILQQDWGLWSSALLLCHHYCKLLPAAVMSFGCSSLVVRVESNVLHYYASTVHFGCECFELLRLSQLFERKPS